MLNEQERQQQESRKVADDIRARLTEFERAGVDTLTPDDKEFIAARRSYLTTEQAKVFEDVIEEGLASMKARAGGASGTAAPTASGSANTSPIGKLTVKELQAKAAELGIDASKLKKKADLVAAIDAKLSSPQ